MEIVVVAFVRTAKRVKDYILIVPKKSFGDRRRELLINITLLRFPNVKQEVERFSDCEQKLRFLGPARETDDQ